MFFYDIVNDIFNDIFDEVGNIVEMIIESIAINATSLGDMFDGNFVAEERLKQFFLWFGRIWCRRGAF